MNKVISLLSIFASSLVFQACTEKGVPIDFGDVLAKDTTYMAAVPTAEPHRVLIEELTGVKCVNCPAGHQLLETFEASNPGRIEVVSIQPLYSDALTGPKKNYTKNDNRTQKGTDLSNFIFNAKQPNLPSAAIDRSPFPGTTDLDGNRGAWSNVVDARLAVNTGVNLSLVSEYREATNDAVIKIKVSFSKNVNKQLLLNIALTESSIIDYQEDVTLGDIEDYTHNNVFRDMITPVSGTSILNDFPVKEAGRVYERTIIYQLPEQTKWKPENMHIVASVSVNESNEKEVLQAAGAKLK